MVMGKVSARQPMVLRYLVQGSLGWELGASVAGLRDAINII